MGPRDNLIARLLHHSKQSETHKTCENTQIIEFYCTNYDCINYMYNTQIFLFIQIISEQTVASKVKVDACGRI